MKSIGIDIGTTTISIVLVSHPDLTVIKSLTLPNDTFLPKARPWERLQDVPSILAKVLPALEGLLAEHGDIAAIGLTGQMHGIVYLDKDGSPLSPLYTWQDGRGNLPDYHSGKSVCAVLNESFGIKAATGYGLVTHLYNLKKGLVPSAAVSFCTIADYVGMALTGRTSPLLHISQAASLGLYDCKANTFNLNIVQALSVPTTFLPQITAGPDMLGAFRGIPVFVSIGDNQASFLGSVGKSRDSVLVNIGTGSQISVLSGTCFESSGIEARPFTADSYLLVGAALCGGAAYAALERFFREYAIAAGGKDQPQYDIMQAFLAEPHDSTQDWQVRTAFSGTRENPEDSGSMTGIRLDNFHPAALIRGVLSGMAQELYDLYRVIWQGTGISCARLVASGNGVRKNSALQDILQERFEMRLEIEPHEEEAAFGAALFAHSALSPNESA